MKRKVRETLHESSLNYAGADELHFGRPAQNKEDTIELQAEKAAMDKESAELVVKSAQAEIEMRKKANTIGNIVHESVPISATEVSRALVRNLRLVYMRADALQTGRQPRREDISPRRHDAQQRDDEASSRSRTYDEGGHPVSPRGHVPTGNHRYGARCAEMPMRSKRRTTHVLRLPHTGTKVAGHRGYYLVGDGLDLNQAMITYGLQFLKGKGFTKIQAPFFMNKPVMAKTAQLSEFDEALYRVSC